MAKADEKTKNQTILREYGFRATPIRKLALKILIETHEALSIQELFDSLNSNSKIGNPDWATVYRILTQFEEAGLVFSFEANGVKKFEYADPQAKHHHHHLICRECKRIEHLSACQTKTLQKMIQSFHFKDVSHKLEFYGLCPDCAR